MKRLVWTVGLPWILILATMAAEDRYGDPLPEGAVQRLGTLKFTYLSGIGDLCYLPDGRVAIAVGAALDVWNMSEGSRSARVEVTPHAIKSAQPSSDGSRILLATAAGNVLELDLASGVVGHAIGTELPSLVRAVYSPDGTRVLTTSSSPPTVCEWELVSGRQLVCAKVGMHSLREAVYSPDGRRFYVDGANGSGPVLAEHELERGDLVKAWHKDYYAHSRSLVVSPDGERLLLGSRHMATEWQLPDRKLLRKFTGHHGHAVTAVAYCASPERLLTGSRDGSIRLWDRLTGKVLLRWFPHNGHVTRIQVSPDGKWVLSYGGGTVAECSIETGRPRLDWERHTDSVEDAVLLPGKALAMSASADGSLRFWNVADGVGMRRIACAGKGVYCLSVSADGQVAAVGCKDGTVREFRVEDGAAGRVLKHHRGYVRSVCYAGAGTLYSAAGDGRICSWLPGAETPAATLSGHRGGVLALAVSADGARLVSGGRDGTVRLWDAATGEEIRVLTTHDSWVTGVCFAGDNQVVSVGLDGFLRLLDGNGEAMRGQVDVGSRLFCVARLSGTTACCGAEDGGIRAWDIPSGKLLFELKGHASAVRAIAYDPGSKTLVSASRDGSLLVWKPELREAAAP